MSATAEVVEQEVVEEQAVALVEEARAITIGSDEQYETAGEFLRTRIKAVRQEIGEVFDPIIRAAHQAHREALAQKRKVEAPVIEAEKLVKGSMAKYHREREAERRRLEEEARREARKRAETEALERAAELESQGKKEEAEALIERPVETPVVTPAEPTPKAEGVSVRKIWKFRVTDLEKVAKSYLIADEKKIGQIVRAMGADAEKLVGGIEVWAEEVVSARSA